jgi:anaerobic selenocysteine-containing dehydrogenase
MGNERNPMDRKPGRRDFLKKGVAAAGVATVGSGLLTSRQSAAQSVGGSGLNEGDELESRRRRFPNQSHHAGADHLPEQKVPGGVDHPANRNRGCSHGRCSILH